MNSSNSPGLLFSNFPLSCNSSFRDSIDSFYSLYHFQIDVAGTMQFWDISIDTASSVLLILCFGLAVDYSAHVGHCFMTHTGSRDGKNELKMLTEFIVMDSNRCLPSMALNSSH